jgi:hypothetical protein
MKRYLIAKAILNNALIYFYQNELAQEHKKHQEMKLLNANIEQLIEEQEATIENLEANMALPRAVVKLKFRLLEKIKQHEDKSTFQSASALALMLHTHFKDYQFSSTPYAVKLWVCLELAIIEMSRGEEALNFTLDPKTQKITNSLVHNQHRIFLSNYYIKKIKTAMNNQEFELGCATKPILRK